MKQRLIVLSSAQINLNVWTHLVIHLVKPSKQRWHSCRPLCSRVVTPEQRAPVPEIIDRQTLGVLHYVLLQVHSAERAACPALQ